MRSPWTLQHRSTSMPDSSQPNRGERGTNHVLGVVALLVVTTALIVAAIATTAIARSGDDERVPSAADHSKMKGLNPSARADAMRAAMTGDAVQAPGGPHDLDSLLFPPAASPPGSTLRVYNLTARDEQVEIADGITFNAWTYNGTVPGPVIRATEGERIRINFTNKASHAHTIHTHGIHPADQDGVFEIVEPGESYTYEYIATPYGVHPFHCHMTPLKKHISKGMYGTFIIDPPKPRPKAKELVMVMNGFDTDVDDENNIYTVNGKAFYYAKYPIKVKRGELVRIYLSNMTEFDAVNSLHLHGNFFTYYPVGRLESKLFTDVVTLGQGDRGIIETRFPYPGKFMFHAHQSEFADLGWMGFFEVKE